MTEAANVSSASNCLKVNKPNLVFVKDLDQKHSLFIRSHCAGTRENRVQSDRFHED